MQLLIFVLAAFGLGYWFSRSRAADRLTEGTKNLTGRLRRKPSSGSEEVASGSDTSAGA
jgi:hypothetical protein